MKKIYGYAALFAAMSLASCSSDNEPNIATGEMEKCYISVNLAVPTDTRADFVPGDAKESAVHSVTFVAFDAAGNYLSSSAPIKDFNWTPGTGSIENTSASKLIELEKQEGKTVGQIMAIVNCPSTLDVTNKSLVTLRKTVGDYTTTKLDNIDYFVMTNSAYGDGNYATDFADHVYETAGEAIKDPIPMYVERAAARVDISQETTFTDKYEVDGIKVDGDKTLEVKIDGVTFIYAKDGANLVKDIDGITDANAFTGWNVPADFRSHWAVKSDANYIKAYYNKVNALGTIKDYLNENVDQDQPTYVTVTGKLLLDGEQTEIYQLFNNSQYYTKEGVINQLLAYLQLDGYRYVANETDEIASGWRYITEDDIDIVAATSTDYDGYLQIKAAKNGYRLVKVEGEGEDDKELGTGAYTINDNKYRVYVWGGGNTYFYVQIAPEDQGNKPGVVRNHVYNLKFEKIGGIGTPLFNPDGELLPKNPDTTVDEGPKWYFNATINILKWTVYTQGIDFSKK